MKITEFLKKYSLIDSKFIDDFYLFYDKNQNEYDYTIDLDKLSNQIIKNKLSNQIIKNQSKINSIIINNN